MHKIPYFIPDIGPADLNSVKKIILSKWISAGKILSECEKIFAKNIHNFLL